MLAGSLGWGSRQAVAVWVGEQAGSSSMGGEREYDCWEPRGAWRDGWGGVPSVCMQVEGRVGGECPVFVCRRRDGGGGVPSVCMQEEWAWAGVDIGWRECEGVSAWCLYVGWGG